MKWKGNNWGYDPHPGNSCAFKTNANIQKVNEIV